MKMNKGLVIGSVLVVVLLAGIIGVNASVFSSNSQDVQNGFNGCPKPPANFCQSNSDDGKIDCVADGQNNACEWKCHCSNPNYDCVKTAKKCTDGNGCSNTNRCFSYDSMVFDFGSDF